MRKLFFKKQFFLKEIISDIPISMLPALLPKVLNNFCLQYIYKSNWLAAYSESMRLNLMYNDLSRRWYTLIKNKSKHLGYNLK